MRLMLINLIFTANACSIFPTKKASQDHACSLIEINRAWKRAVIKTESKWGISPGMQLSFILTESNFRPRAKTQRTYFLGFFPTGRLSSAFGYAQAIDSTWETYQKSTGNRFSSRTNFADSVDFIGWYANETSQRLKIKKSDVTNQYLAYHQGHRGYSRGAYKNKPNLIEIAKKTNKNAFKYDKQLKNCL